MIETKICKTCHEEKPIENFTLLKGKYRRNMCYSCKTKYMAKYRAEHRTETNLTAQLSHYWARLKRPISFMIYGAKQRAQRKNLPFDLTPTDIQIPDRCPVLGIPLEFSHTGTGGITDNSPSLDRIKPELGYVKGNVAVISKRANTIKSFGSIEEHQKVIDYMKLHCLN